MRNSHCLITKFDKFHLHSFRATIEIANVVKKGEVDTWLNLEQAKHGMVHLRLTWLELSSNKDDLKAALAETQMLRVTDMSTALLTVFVDSAKNLPVSFESARLTNS